ncbi:MAG: HAD family hydrolase [Bacteroidota bacterium]
MKPALLIFDCDGVLVDSEPISTRIIAQLLSEYGLATTPREALNRFAGGSLQRVGDYYREQMGQALAAVFEERYRAECQRAFAQELEAVEGVEAVLRAWTGPKSVGSNGPRAKIEANLQKTGLIDYFEGRLYSAYDLGHWKPEPQLYLHAARAYGVDPTACAVVEDSVHGVLAGVAAGMRVYGYTATVGQAALSAAGAIPFSHMSELIDLLTAETT